MWGVKYFENSFLGGQNLKCQDAEEGIKWCGWKNSQEVRVAGMGMRETEGDGIGGQAIVRLWASF